METHGLHQTVTRVGRFIFWSSIATLLYTFLLFPIVIVLRGLLAERIIQTGSVQPQIAVIVAAYNEESAIREKIDNLLSTTYPSDRLEIIIASDGSDDATNDIVGEYGHQGVRLLRLPRAGKAAALAAAVQAAHADILVFSDANSVFTPNALAELVAPYADPDVGGVAGNQVYRSKEVTLADESGERAYWNFDRVLKDFESRAGNTIAATGAIYSIRKGLFRPIPPGVNDDFYLSLGVIEQGQRLVFSSQAIAYEPPGQSLDREFERKVRVLSRAIRCVVEMRELLNPFRYGFYSVQLFSHKVLRWAVVVPVGVLSVASVILVRQGWIYTLATVVQLLAHTLGVIGILLRGHPAGQSRIVSVPAYFLMANTAAAVAGWNLLRGKRIESWSTTRAPFRIGSAG